jgi:predicted membrane GTPase involved in stress response
MRFLSKGITVGLIAPIKMLLDAVEYLAVADEVLEVTPTKKHMV